MFTIINHLTHDQVYVQIESQLLSEEIFVINVYNFLELKLKWTVNNFTSTCPSRQVTPNLTCPDRNRFVTVKKNWYFYRPQRSWAKVIFSQACFCPQRGEGEGCLPQCMLGCPPPGTDTPQEQTPPPPSVADTPPGSRPTPLKQTPLRSRHTHPPEQTPPLGADTPHPTPPPRSRHPPGSRLQHTVNERPVRILLECILVLKNLTLSTWASNLKI